MQPHPPSARESSAYSPQTLITQCFLQKNGQMLPVPKLTGGPPKSDAHIFQMLLESPPHSSELASIQRPPKKRTPPDGRWCFDFECRRRQQNVDRKTYLVGRKLRSCPNSHVDACQPCQPLKFKLPSIRSAMQPNAEIVSYARNEFQVLLPTLLSDLCHRMLDCRTVGRSCRSRS